MYSYRLQPLSQKTLIHNKYYTRIILFILLEYLLINELNKIC